MSTEVKELMERILDFCREHQTALIVAGVILVVLLLCVVFARSARRESQEEPDVEERLEGPEKPEKASGSAEPEPDVEAAETPEPLQPEGCEERELNESEVETADATEEPGAVEEAPEIVWEAAEIVQAAPEIIDAQVAPEIIDAQVAPEIIDAQDVPEMIGKAPEMADTQETAETQEISEEKEAEREPDADREAPELRQRQQAEVWNAVSAVSHLPMTNLKSVEIRIEKAQITLHYATPAECAGRDGEGTCKAPVEISCEGSCEESEDRPESGADGVQPTDEESCQTQVECVDLEIHRDAADFVKANRALRKFGPENQNVSRSGREYTEAELYEQIKD